MFNWDASWEKGDFMAYEDSEGPDQDAHACASWSVPSLSALWNTKPYRRSSYAPQTLIFMVGWADWSGHLLLRPLLSWCGSFRWTSINSIHCEYIKPLILTTLWANSADYKLVIFFFLSFPETRLWQEKTVCMKRQKLFSGKKKKNILNLRLLNFLPSKLSINAV